MFSVFSLPVHYCTIINIVHISTYIQWAWAIVSTHISTPKTAVRNLNSVDQISTILCFSSTKLLIVLPFSPLSLIKETLKVR